MSLSIAEAIMEASQVLRAAGVPDARREASSLLQAVLQAGQAFLITHSEDPITVEVLAVFRDWTVRRAQGEPLQYISGHQEFFGLDFEVNHDVLIPRPETELLVETSLELIEEAQPAPLICDVGTGSGCIVISLLHKRKNAGAFAVDISPAAIPIALRNARRHQVSERVKFVVADGFTGFRKEGLSFDLIVSNPPYIADKDFRDLQREVRDYEPRVALTSGSDGLRMIHRLLNEASWFLVAGGYLLLEIGYAQLAAVEQLIDARVWTIAAVRNDLQRIPRTLALQKK
jgi:release factor glutamine methyltransferase